MSQRLKSALVTGLALVAVFGLAACGSDSHRHPSSTKAAVVRVPTVVARVGGMPLAAKTLEHWMTIMASGPVPDPPTYSGCIARERSSSEEKLSVAAFKKNCEKQYEKLRQQTLSYLISAHWLIGVAAERGERVSPRDVQREFQRVKRESSPNSDQEFRESLSETGETVADVKFKAEAELASVRVHRELVKEERPTSAAQISRYYHQHRRQFLVQEARTIEIVERKTEAEAVKVRREIEGGKRIQSMNPFRQVIERFGGVGGSRSASIEKSIFAAKPNVLIGPLRLRVSYGVYLVRHIAPARIRTLGEVSSSIGQLLTEQQRKQVLASFLAGLSAKWAPETTCEPGFVVKQCREYKGPDASSEDPFSLV